MEPFLFMEELILGCHRWFTAKVNYGPNTKHYTNLHKELVIQRELKALEARH